jgi:hypothetical protein
MKSTKGTIHKGYVVECATPDCEQRGVVYHLVGITQEKAVAELRKEGWKQRKAGWTCMRCNAPAETVALWAEPSEEA